ncbi:MAG: glycosyltransferase [Candidatus Micrarchaeota archaeon]|nr:glycosyltransferase [Candidatus Micrarchaeota archaeon]
MRIGFFVDRLSLTDGISIALGTLRRELESKGHEVYIFSPGHRKKKEANEDPKIFYFTSPIFKDYPDFNIATLPNNSAYELGKKLNLDVIHSFAMGPMGISAFNVAKRMKIPSLLSVNSFPYKNIDSFFTNGLGNLVHKLAIKYMKWYFSSFTCLCTPSQYASDMLEREMGAKARELLPLGINHADFSGKNAKKENGKFIYAGKISKEKDLDLIISSMPSVSNRIENANAYIYGEGPYREILLEKAITSKIDNRVMIGSFLTKRKLASEFSTSSLFLFPAQLDTQSLSVIEGMAAGVVPICSQDSCVYELIKGTELERFSFNNKKDFSEKVVYAHNDANDRDTALASRIAEDYGIEKIGKRHIEAYEKLIKK